MKNLLLIFVLLLACQVRATNEYFVGPDGNDGNAGTSQGAAWLTIQKAQTTVAAGDTVNLSGEFDEDNSDGAKDGLNTCMYISTSGTAALPILWRLDPDSASVTIYGNKGVANRWACIFASDSKLNEFENITWSDGHKGVFLNGADSMTFTDCVGTRMKGTGSEQNTGGSFPDYRGWVDSCGVPGGDNSSCANSSTMSGTISISGKVTIK